MSLPLQEDLEEFTTTYRREIVFNLQQLIDRGERVSVVFDEGRETFLTVLLAVNDEKDILAFDWGGSEEINRRFLASERCVFVCSPHGVHNQFPAGRPQEVTYKGRRAFAVHVPTHYTRLQRRQAFRLVLPVTQRPQCTLAPTGKGQQPVFSVVDIGLGGVGIETPAPASAFTLGQILPGAAIDLKGFGMLRVDLEVRFAGAVQRGAKQLGRLGCRFVSITPAQEHQLQKFITHVQREERSRLAGGL